MSSLLLLTNYVEEVVAGYAVASISLILIGVSLLIILYRIQKWIIKVDENMSYLREVLQFYKIQQKEKETKKTSHYNILTNKQVISTDYIVIFKSEKNKVIAYKCNLSEYYSYKVGTTYIFYHEID